MNNSGVPYVIGICCVWPVIVHFGIVYISRAISQRDWTSIQWSSIRWPWSKQ